MSGDVVDLTGQEFYDEDDLEELDEDAAAPAELTAFDAEALSEQEEAERLYSDFSAIASSHWPCRSVDWF